MQTLLTSILRTHLLNQHIHISSVHPNGKDYTYGISIMKEVKEIKIDGKNYVDRESTSLMYANINDEIIIPFSSIHLMNHDTELGFYQDNVLVTTMHLHHFPGDPMPCFSNELQHLFLTTTIQ